MCIRDRLNIINGGFKLKDANELIVKPLLCDVATATPVANEPNAFFRMFSSKSADI